MRELIVDLFAGGGGASTGIEAATGRPVDVAINHSLTALAVHEANHPLTRHLVTDVFDVDPRTVVATNERVGLLWASPDCTHFSTAKGGKPRKQNIRSLAEVVVQWADCLGPKRRPRVIVVENVREFLTWGPLDRKGFPIKERAGELWDRWRTRLEMLGYTVEWRVLDASEYGAPTKRKRLFIVARCDGQPVVWPEKTHGPGLTPFRTAANCIDWSIPTQSIFDRKRPLAEKTMARIAAGIRRYVLEDPDPFVITIDHQSSNHAEAPVDAPLTTITTKQRHAVVAPSIVKVNHGGPADRTERITEPLSTVTAARRGHALVAPTLVQTGYGERQGQRPRSLDLQEPLGTVVAGGSKHALVMAFLAKHYGGVVGTSLKERVSTVTTRDHHSLVSTHLMVLRNNANGRDAREPVPTITAGGKHVAEVRAFLAAFYGSGSGKVGHSLKPPLPTVTTRDRFGLVTVNGVDHIITDIGMRMLEPHELLAAQFGRFASEYDMSAAETKQDKVRLIGNSVCPEVAEAIVRANVAPTKKGRMAA